MALAATSEACLLAYEVSEEFGLNGARVGCQFFPPGCQ